MHTHRTQMPYRSPSASRWFRARALTAAMLLVLSAGARPVAANDLSNSPCTAGDVEIVGSGLIINEPCACPVGGTFSATVQFVVRNNTSSGRYCVSLHLVPDGVVITVPYDVVLRDAKGSSTATGRSGSEPYHDTVMFGSIPNFPCTTGLVCFGGSDVVSGKCAPLGCSTVSWNTSNSASACTTADQNPPGGQCRHEQVCIVGFGATLQCITNCGVGCQATATLQACVNAPTSRGPFQLTLAGSDGSSATQSTFGDPSGTACVNFTVTPGQYPTTTYTLTVTDKDGCTRTATTSLQARQNPTANAGPDEAKCSTDATASFTLAGVATIGTPTWSVVSGSAAIAAPSSPTSGVTVTGTGSATLRLTVSNPPCPDKTDDVTLTVNAPPTAGAGPDQSKCSAGATTSFTMAGTASGGTPTWSVVSGPVVIGDPSKLNTGVTFTGGGSARLRLTVASNATPACADAIDDVDLNVTAGTVLISAPTPGCNGILTYTAAVDGQTGCTFSWSVDGRSLKTFLPGPADDARVARVSGTNFGTFQFRALDNVCHSIEVAATCSVNGQACTARASTTVTQCATTSQGCNKP